MEADVFDLDGALKRFDGDEELLLDVIGFFLDDAPVYLEQVREGLRTGDAATVNRAAHSLKGLAANFGAPRAVEVSRSMEFLARDGNLAGAEAKLPQLEQEIQQLRDALVAYRQQQQQEK